MRTTGCGPDIVNHRPHDGDGGPTCGRWPGAVTVLACVAVLLTACLPQPHDGRSGSGAGRDAEEFSWPDPSPSRPVVDLRFTMSEDLASVDGYERVVFTPDLDVCELVFRLWPNKPMTAGRGNELEVTEVEVDRSPATFEVIPAGAPDGTTGTLLEVPVPSCIEAGTEVTAELAFTLTLGEGTNERIGVGADHELAWLGTAFPLLAWESERGWARDPAVNVIGEMATSETFRLRSLEVTAPSRFDVVGIGARRGPPRPAGSGATTHHFRADAVRDVAVTVGRVDVVTRELDGAQLHVGVPAGGARASATRWAAEIERSIEKVVGQLGPLPYEDVWVSVVPDQTSGIEFPGALQFGDLAPEDERWLITHEVAHLWFYGLVGNNQARDPWLDEAFATFVQLVVDGDHELDDVAETFAERRNDVGRPMSYWERFDRPSSAYVHGVYREGAAALLEARERAGAQAFDDAITDYLVANAHRIAVPADLESALSHLPEALDVLRRAGAFEGPPGRVPRPEPARYGIGVGSASPGTDVAMEGWRNAQVRRRPRSAGRARRQGSPTHRPGAVHRNLPRSGRDHHSSICSTTVDRSGASSLRRIAAMWVRTVTGATNNRSAISLVVNPCRISSATSRSRAVSRA